MNLIDAVYQAIESKIGAGNSESYEANCYFQKSSEIEKNFINDFFYRLFGYEFVDLLDWCGGKIDKPITRKISVNWSIEDVQNVRPDLGDDESAKVLEFLVCNHDAAIGINWEAINCCCDMLYPSNSEE